MTAAQLRGADDAWVLGQLGVVGLRTVHELRGQPCDELMAAAPVRQGITVSRSFGRPVASRDELAEAVAADVSRAGEKLRRDGLAAGVLLVFAMTNLFREGEKHYFDSHTISLPRASSDTGELIRYAIEGVEKIYRPGCRFKKAGVMLHDLVPSDRVQGNLFDTADRAKSRRLMAAIDQVNARSSSPVRYAAGGIARPWQARFEKRSPRYTTHWSDLPKVQAV